MVPGLPKFRVRGQLPGPFQPVREAPLYQTSKFIWSMLGFCDRIAPKSLLEATGSSEPQPPGQRQLSGTLLFGLRAGTFQKSRGTFPILSRDPSFQETVKNLGETAGFWK